MVIKILVITPIKHIKRFKENFPKNFKLKIYEDIDSSVFSKNC